MSGVVDRPQRAADGRADPARTRLRVLTFTTLYPNAAQPSHGIFVENRIRNLAASGEVDIEVVAPMPVFPVARRVSVRYADKAAPAHETRHGLRVHHPRYALVPKLTVPVAPYLMYRAARPCIAALRAGGFDFDLIDAHYFYPDGVAAALLARHFGKPLTITGRGTDLNVLPGYRLPRMMILWAAARAAGLVTVSRSLKDRLIELGIAESRVRVLRNGIDLRLFRPQDREAARRRFGLDGSVLLAVGNLVTEKGHDLAIEALALLPGHRLALVGSGPEEQRLKDLAARRGVADRVHLLGRMPHDELPAVYSAADLLVLASTREGWPNVLLEAMACGTPVVAASVGGVPEVVAAPAAGELFRERTPSALAAAVERAVARRIDRAATRAYAEAFGWDETTNGQLALFRSIVASR